MGGTASDLLMVNTSGSYLEPVTGPPGLRYRELLGWILQNATDSEGITIASMTVTWSGVPPARRLQEIWLNNSLSWSGNARSRENCNINDFTLSTTTTITDNRLVFNGSMEGATISIEFVMTDGSSKTLTVYPASQNYSFTVKSTGKTTSANIYRTIEVDYNALTGKITRYDEINTQITP